MTCRLLAALSALILVLVAQATPAFAWGERGHRLVGTLAFELLNPTAKAEVQELLAVDRRYRIRACPVNTLADAAVWADCVRDIPSYDWLTPLHYDNPPRCGARPKSEYCPDGLCNTETIKKYRDLLRDLNASKLKKLQALELLAHFVGDIHQPLHAVTNNDRGGGRVMVSAYGDTWKLHGLWDTGMTEKMLPSNAARTGGPLWTLATANRDAWRNANPDDWAAESLKISQEFVYPRLATPPACDSGRDAPIVQGGVISAEYISDADPIIQERIAKAAVRLADMLNTVFPEPTR